MTPVEQMHSMKVITHSWHLKRTGIHSFFVTFRYLGSRHAFVLCVRHLHISRPERVGRAGWTPGSENFYPTHPPLKFKNAVNELIITFQMSKLNSTLKLDMLKSSRPQISNSIKPPKFQVVWHRRFQKSIFQKLRTRTRRRRTQLA